ncbi:MAG: MFS transporter [Chloroflexi bacterium]|nr:MFS transporter [Chloroflexota bacterium]
MPGRVSQFSDRLIQSLIGPLPAQVRSNFMKDLAAQVCVGIFLSVVSSFTPVVLRKMGAPPLLLAFHQSGAYVGGLFTTLSVIFLSRRRKLPYIVLSWGLGRGIFLFTFLIFKPEWLLVLTVGYFLFESLPGPGYSQVMYQMYPAQLRGRLMATVRIGMAAAMLITAPIAGLLLDRIGYRVLFPIASLFGIAAALIVSRWQVDEQPASQQSAPPLSFKAIWSVLLSDRRFVTYAMSLILYGMGALMMSPFVPLVQVDRLGLTYSDIGVLGIIQSLCWLAGFYYWGRAVDRRGPIWTLRANLMIFALIPATYLLATQGWMLVVAFAASGIISGGLDLTFINAPYRLAQNGRIQEYAALQSSLLSLRGFLAPLLGALLYSMVGINMIFVISLGLVISSWFFIFAVERQLQREAAGGSAA